MACGTAFVAASAYKLARSRLTTSVPGYAVSNLLYWLHFYLVKGQRLFLFQDRTKSFHNADLCAMPNHQYLVRVAPGLQQLNLDGEVHVESISASINAKLTS